MPTLALPAVAVLGPKGGGHSAQADCVIYTLGFWTVAGIVAAKTGTFPLEWFLAFSTGFGVIAAAVKEKDEKNDRPAPEEKP